MYRRTNVPSDGTIQSSDNQGEKPAFFKMNQQGTMTSATTTMYPIISMGMIIIRNR